MGPLHNVLNRVHAWNEQGYTFKSVICSRAANLCVATPLSALAVAQNIFATPFTAVGTAAKMVVKPVAWISGSKALHRLANQLPGITDLLLKIANIVRYVLSAAANATLGVLSPTANFRAQCALETTYDKKAAIQAIQELARRAAEIEFAAAAKAAKQAAEEARKTEEQVAAAAAKKAAEQAEAARKATEVKKQAEQAAAEATRKAVEKAAVEAANKAAEQAAHATKNAAESQTIEIEVTDELEATDLLTQLMEDDEYELEEEILPVVKQDNWLSKLLSKIRPANKQAA